jgi:hypothetical protein
MADARLFDIGNKYNEGVTLSDTLDCFLKRSHYKISNEFSFNFMECRGYRRHPARTNSCSWPLLLEWH